jgi:hypothetical protein
VSVFIEKALDCMKLKELFEAFAYQNAYTFFIDKIEDMLKQKYQGNEIYAGKMYNGSKSLNISGINSLNTSRSMASIF